MKSLRRAWLIAAALFYLDAFVLNQGSIAVFTLLSVFFYRLPRAFLAVREPDIRKNRLQRAGIYTLMAVLILAANLLNNAHARSQAVRLITKCNDYKAKYGRFPDSLEALVPEFIHRVPRAKLVPGRNGRFTYTAAADSHQLMYTSLPPFARRFYVLEERTWKTLD
ncbi:MAG: hypothetical protein WC728_16385 [Elusimicrobiota bacterium]